mgnify:CR=1 FL=1
MRKLTMAVLFSIGFLTPALAGPAAQSGTWPEAQNISETTSQEVVCHFIYHEGTILPRQTCLTQRQWDNARREFQEQLREYQMYRLFQ